jgi:hypothetical protein
MNPEKLQEMGLGSQPCVGFVLMYILRSALQYFEEENTNHKNSERLM